MKNIICLMFIALFAVSGCKKNEALVYDTTNTKNAIYFQKNAGYTMNNEGIVIKRTYCDSTVYSMANLLPDKKELKMSMLLKVYGTLEDYRRKVDLKINEELTTAVRGVDYDIDLDTVYVEPGKSTVNLYFTMYRTDKLQNEKVRLAIDVLPNENFDVMKEFMGSNLANTSGEPMCGTTFKYIYSDMMSEPWIYSIFGTDYFGDWTIVKYNIINSIMGWTHNGWENNWNAAGNNPSYGKLSYAAILTQAYLQELADKGEPATEVDGSYVQLVGSYQVDYSAYEIQ